MKIHIEIDAYDGIQQADRDTLLALAGFGKTPPGYGVQPHIAEEEEDCDDEPQEPTEAEVRRVTQPGEKTPGMIAHEAEMDRIAASAGSAMREQNDEDGEPGAESTDFGEPPTSEKDIKAMKVPELRHWSSLGGLPIEDGAGYKIKAPELKAALIDLISASVPQAPPVPDPQMEAEPAPPAPQSRSRLRLPLRRSPPRLRPEGSRVSRSELI